METEVCKTSSLERMSLLGIRFAVVVDGGGGDAVGVDDKSGVAGEERIVFSISSCIKESNV